MSVTRITAFINNSGKSITVESTDGSNNQMTLVGDQPGIPQVPQWECNCPWANNADEFKKRNIKFTATDKSVFYIWQQDYPGDGDYVRYSTTGYVKNGTHVGGHAGVGGHRICVIGKDYTPFFYRIP